MSAQGVDPGLAWRLRHILDPPRARLWRSTNQAIATATLTAISFDTADYSVGGGWYAAVNPTRWTAPVSGLYDVTATLILDGVIGGARRHAQVRKNGTDVVDSMELPPPAAAGNNSGLKCATPVELAAGDYLELIAFHDLGVNLNALTLATHRAPVLTVCRRVDRA